MKLESITTTQSRTLEAIKRPAFAVLGMESVGKSSLLSALSGQFTESSPLAGTTLRCQRYQDGDCDWIDTPGIVSGYDAATVQQAVQASDSADAIVLILRADRACEELVALRPILNRRRVAIILTFRDRLAPKNEQLQQRILSTWREQLSVPVELIDSRTPDANELAQLRASVIEARALEPGIPASLPVFPTIKQASLTRRLERTLGFAPLSLLLLFGPAWLAVTQANALADRCYDSIRTALEHLLLWLNACPAPLNLLLAGDYGIVAMFPFLLLYALPTILIFTSLIALYKSTGVIDRLSYALHPWLKPFGLGGRDLVRVVMGFGCNVPAVIATRACSSCSRGACVSAISFGSACSYQLPATLAIFAAAGLAWLGPVYLALLAVTTLVYLRCTTPAVLRHAQNKMILPALGHLRGPNWQAMLRESRHSLRDFTVMALPIYIGICILAGLLQWSGALGGLIGLLAPVMAAFHLPAEAALAIVLGSVRKDGLAIGLLDAESGALKVPLETSIQVLTIVYLAGVLLPCTVTLLTIVREMRPHFALRILGRQAAFAAVFSLGIAWGGALLISFTH